MDENGNIETKRNKSKRELNSSDQTQYGDASNGESMNDQQDNCERTQIVDLTNTTGKKSSKNAQEEVCDRTQMPELSNTAKTISEKTAQQQSCEKTQIVDISTPIPKQTSTKIQQASSEQIVDMPIRKVKSRRNVAATTLLAEAKTQTPDPSAKSKEKCKLLSVDIRTRITKRKGDKKTSTDAISCVPGAPGDFTKTQLDPALATTKKQSRTEHKETSIKDRLKRGLRTAFAFSKASFDQAYQSAKAKAKVGFVRSKGILYEYQDTYWGGGQHYDEEDDEDEEDMEALTDTSHRPDLILVTTNNTNQGRIYNEKGRPFWKDKIFKEEIPKYQRKPLSSLLFLLAEKKLVLKEPVAPPTNVDGLEELSDIKQRDRMHFNDELLISNTVRSIIGTLDGLDDYANKQPQKIHRLEVVEPKTAVNYSRHYPTNNERVPFVYSGLGVCKTTNKKFKSSSSSSTNSCSTTSDQEHSSRRKRTKKKNKYGDMEEGERDNRKVRRRSTRK